MDSSFLLVHRWIPSPKHHWFAGGFHNLVVPRSSGFPSSRLGVFPLRVSLSPTLTKVGSWNSRRILSTCFCSAREKPESSAVEKVLAFTSNLWKTCVVCMLSVADQNSLLKDDFFFFLGAFCYMFVAHSIIYLAILISFWMFYVGRFFICIFLICCLNGEV